MDTVTELEKLRETLSKIAAVLCSRCLTYKEQDVRLRKILGLENRDTVTIDEESYHRHEFFPERRYAQDGLND